MRTLQKTRKLRKTARIASLFLLLAVPIGLIMANHFGQTTEAIGFTGISPSSGPTTGGTDVTIAGQYLAQQSLTIKQIAAGSYHTCAIASDDKAYCWGFNNHGQLGNNSTTNSSIPVAVYTSGELLNKTIKQITAGSSHTCVIASDDKAYCWGYNYYGRLGNNSTIDSSVPVAVFNTSGVLSGLTIKQITAGSSHTCVIASDDKAYCWGYNYYGRLGNNSTIDSSVPVAVYTSGELLNKTIKQITAGSSYVCAIASDNQAYCWGYNGDGQLGNNSITGSSTPVAVYTSGVLSDKTIKQITASESHTCAIASDNQAYCWGRNTYGQLGNNSITDSRAPVAVYTSDVLLNKTVKQISAGSSYTCAIASDDQAYCWGNNQYGQLGNNSITGSRAPVAVYTSGLLSSKIIKQITASNNHTCAIASDNQAYCWGNNYYGQLGNSSTTNSSIPVGPVKMPFTITLDTNGTPAICKDISTGANNITTNFASDGSWVKCKTSAHSAGMTDVTINNGIDAPITLSNAYTYHMTVTSIAPDIGSTAGGTDVTIAGQYLAQQGLTIKQISANGYHTCVIASDDKVYCWGRNSYGALGNNSTTNSSIPVAVDTSGALSGKTFKQISAGSFHTCVIASDDQAYCWGYNSYGQLGNNSTTDSSVPVAVLNTSGVLSGKTIKQITASFGHTCAIASDDQAYCWGQNNYGQLGNSSTTNSSIPVAVYTSDVLSGKTIKQIAASESHTCAITSDNQAYCWGYNYFGSLGSDPITYSSVPVGPVDFSAFKMPFTITLDTNGTPAICKDISTGANNITTNFAADGSWVKCKTSAHVAGKVNVTVNNGVDTPITMSNAYTYSNPVTLTDVAPNHGLVSGDTDVTITGTNIAKDARFTRVKAGSSFSVAIGANGYLYAWGTDTSGQLGDGGECYITEFINYPTDNASRQQRMLDGRGYSDAADLFADESYNFGVTITSWDELAEAYLLDYEWGYPTMDDLLDSEGYSGDLEGFLLYFYGVDNLFDWLYYYWWGYSDSEMVVKQSGCNTPQRVLGGAITSDMQFTDIAAGDNKACAVSISGNVYCWGSGYLGNGVSNNSKSLPVQVKGVGGTDFLSNIRAIAGGTARTCAISSTNVLYCWGSNSSGTMGLSGTSTTPVQLLTDVQDVNLGDAHICALKTDRTIWCWGSKTYGALGDGVTSGSSSTPIQVKGVGGSGYLSDIVSVSSGYNFSCAVDSTGGVYCWGYNTYGQLGNNSATSSSTPVRVLGVGGSGYLSDITQVTTSNVSGTVGYTCAVDNSGGTYCWGYNGYGQLGNNSTTTSRVPIAVSQGAMPNQVVKQVSAGSIHTCAIGSDNKAYCWGSNIYGQLGNAANTDQRIPVAVSPSLNVIFDPSGTPAKCTNVVVASNNNSLTCTTSAHIAGLVDVTIDNTLEAATLSNAYTYQETYLTLTLDSNLVQIGGVNGLTPNSSGVYGSATNTATTTTNNPTGYLLSISTNELNANPNAKDLKHTFLSQYTTGTINTCAWNSGAKTLTNTANALANNTWGFTLNASNRDAGQLCQVPAKDNALTVRATSTDNGELGDNLNIYYGSKMDLAKPSGEYQGTVLYTVVGGI